jgi:hypothetical protein
MPKAPRRSQRLQPKPLVNWLPVLDLALKQGHLTLEALTALYQTGKVVQTLFTDFWISLETIYVPKSLYEELGTTTTLIYVPDTATWTIFFRCFKPNKKFRFFMNPEPTESNILAFSLIVHGYVELAKEILDKTGDRWDGDLANAVLLNGGWDVHQKALTELDLESELLETWAVERQLAPPLFHPPSNPTFLLDVFGRWIS